MLLLKLLVYPLLVCPLLGYAPPAPRARRRGAAPRMAIDAPLSIPVAIKGGDRLAGVRLSDEELRALADAATSSTVALPVLRQFSPRRSWLWRQWSGTIVRRIARREVLLNALLASALVAFVHAPGPQLARRRALVPTQAIDRIWGLCSGLVIFTLSFFLNQAYSLWRRVCVPRDARADARARARSSAILSS